MRSVFVLSLALVAVSAAGWLNYRWLANPLDLTPIAAAAPRMNAVANGSTGPDATGPVQEGSEALQRPLFHANRRPFSPAPVEAAPEPVAEVAPAPVEEPPPPAPAPELRLAGVSLAGKQKRALLGPLAGVEMRWYSEGQTIEGWTLVAISGQAVRIANAGRSVSFKLYPGSVQ